MTDTALCYTTFVKIINETRSLARTLALLTAGIDDVVSRPVHVKEILARSEAVWRRHRENTSTSVPKFGKLHILCNGQDILIDGTPLVLPRRELSILEYLVRNRGRAVTKTQVFHAIYDTTDAELSDSVVEGHISKLRKKLRQNLGYDPISAKRYEGYTFEG